MSRMLVVLFSGILLIGAVAGAYYSYIGIDKVISTSGEDWGQFGDYFGDVAEALLSFISILLLVYTIHLKTRVRVHFPIRC